jgi:agmatine deiminase
MMPAEWETHAACLMQWPTRVELWGDRFGEALADYATVAKAISRFEPVIMVCAPGHAATVREMCGDAVRTLEIPIDDSWARDSGPIFVHDEEGDPVVVSFRFNAWGNRWHPHDADAALAARIGDWLGLEVVRAPLVLEGGAFLVDGAGTLITTEQCLLNPNRNPHLDRDQIEQLLRQYLGVSTIVWLPYGQSTDVGPEGTDGHVDAVAQYVAPGRVLLEVASDPASPDHERGLANLAVLVGAGLEVDILDPGPDPLVPYANHYLANGAVVVPVAGVGDEGPLARLAEIYPDREIVPVPGTVVAFGGGGPHCITQQIPLGVELPV